MGEPQAIHRHLPCGIELAALALPERRTVTMQLRYLVGFIQEGPDKLGLNSIVEQTIDKGTARRSGRELGDAFDAIGARWSSWAGREATGFEFTCLPVFADQALELTAEYLTTPTFPEDSVQVALDLADNEIDDIENDPQDLSSKLLNRQVYGPLLGRHVLGEKSTLRTITRTDVVQHWQTYYRAGYLQVAAAGPLDVPRLADGLQRLFSSVTSAGGLGRRAIPLEFTAACSHHYKELEQEHIGICFPGASLQDPQRYAQRVAIGVLSGGMSGRLFTEVREKQGLVYWVTANTEHPRGAGIVYLGASTTPQRCEQTYRTLLREVDRLGEDLQDEELQRAVTGIVARTETRGDITRARCGELADDLFHYGQVIPREQKLRDIQAVGVADVQDYLRDFPRERLSVLTLGPRELNLD